MDCGCDHHHGHGRRPECGCGSHGPHHGMPGPFSRRFFSSEERIARLEEYLQELQAETNAVEEQIAELKAAR